MGNNAQQAARDLANALWRDFRVTGVANQRSINVRVDPLDPDDESNDDAIDHVVDTAVEVADRYGLELVLGDPWRLTFSPAPPSWVEGIAGKPLPFRNALKQGWKPWVAVTPDLQIRAREGVTFMAQPLSNGQIILSPVRQEQMAGLTSSIGFLPLVALAVPAVKSAFNALKKVIPALDKNHAPTPVPDDDAEIEGIGCAGTCKCGGRR